MAQALIMATLNQKRKPTFRLASAPHNSTASNNGQELLPHQNKIVNGFAKGKALSFAYGSFKERIYCPLTRATGQWLL